MHPESAHERHDLKPARDAARCWQLNTRAWLGRAAIHGLTALFMAVPAQAAPRLAVLAPEASGWLTADVFTAQDLALAARQPVLRVVLAAAAQPPFAQVDADGLITGVQAELLGTLAARLGLRLVPVVLPDEAAVQQAMRDGRADLQLLARPPAMSTMTSQGPRLSLGTGAMPLGLFALRAVRPVPLQRARVALVGASGAQGAGSGRGHLHQFYPGATPSPQADDLAALRAVASQSVDLYLGDLMPALDTLARQAVTGLELRQVLPGAAGHLHFALIERHAALLPILNKGIIAWRGTPLGHQALMRAALANAKGLRQPLLLSGDGDDARGPSVMSVLVAPPPLLKLEAPQKLALAEHASWRVGVPDQAGDLAGIDRDGRPTGMASGVLQWLSQHLGVVIVPVAMGQPAGLQQALDSGSIDVVPAATQTADLARSLAFSLPWLALPNVLVGRQDAPLYWDLHSLRGKRLAVDLRHPLRDQIRLAHPGIQWVDAANGEEALALVAKGHADAAMAIKPVTQRVLASAAGQGLRALGDVTEWPVMYRFAGADKMRALMPLLDESLQAMGAEQQQALLRRWVAHDLPVVPSPAVWARGGWGWIAATAAVAMTLGGLIGVLSFWRWPARRVRFAASSSGPEATGRLATAALNERLVSPAPQPPSSSPTARSGPDLVDQADVVQALMLPTMLADVVEGLRAVAQAKGLRLDWILDEALPGHVRLDPVPVGQLLTELVGHAIQTTDSGRVLLRARLVPSESGRSHLVFDVRDTGPGLSLADQARLLGNEGDEGAPQPGIAAPDGLSPTSLGLHRAQQLVAQLNGRIELRSQPGKGSLVRVRLALHGRGSPGADRA